MKYLWKDEGRGCSSEGNDQGLEPIALVGIGCRFPGGAHTPELFWNNLIEGKDATSEVPADRWNAARFHDPNGRRGKSLTRRGAFVDQPFKEFDASFFGMSPREAAHLDVQHRWLLEVTWEAMEDAGISPASLTGTQTGVFVGILSEDTKTHFFDTANRDRSGPHTAAATAMTMASNRLSYAFDLCGPSVALDTACSSSLVAVHLACQSLWNGESEVALAGGANAMIRPDYFVIGSQAGMFARDGRCKTFDASADGYCRGEGAGMVLLKPLSAAQRDGDRIYALIRGSGSNQDGKTPGIMVPSRKAQESLIRTVCRRAGVEPGRIRYMEAHGTGTPVGDPIEARALSNTLMEGRPEGETCLVGSVKTNVGHLEAASGVAGLIKAALCLRHRVVPPHLHLKNPNPKIPLEKMRLSVPSVPTPLPDGEGPALAAVNSFGFGGANAHVVLEEAPSASELTVSDSRTHLLPISARTPQALEASVRDYLEAVEKKIEEPSSLSPEVFAASAARRRGPLRHRTTIVAESYADMKQELRAFLEETDADAARIASRGARRPKLVFVMGGMGPQWWAMGRELWEQEPVFRTALEECDAALRRWTGESVLDALLADENDSRMDETRTAQLSQFALQVALTELLRSWGAEADAVVGHSVGEAAAAWASGALSLEDAALVLHHRSRLLDRTTGFGTMAAVGVSAEEAQEAIAAIPDAAKTIGIAAVNGPSSVTLSGDRALLEFLVRPWQESDVFVRFLQVEAPYHSPFVDSIEADLLDGLAELQPRAAEIPFYSTVTAEPTDGESLDASYWFKNARNPVLFAPAAERLLADGYDTFLEIGPHPVLSTSLKACAEAAQERPKNVEVLSTLRRKTPERASLLAAAGRLFALGRKLRWEGLNNATPRADAGLPTYPWQRRVHWDESHFAAWERLAPLDHPLLGRRLADPQPTWEVVLDASQPAFLFDHQVQGGVLLPGAAFVEMGIAALRAALEDPQRVIELSDVRLRQALFLSESPTTVRVRVDPLQLSFEIHSIEDDAGSPTGGVWTLHAQGRALRTRRSAGSTGSGVVPIAPRSKTADGTIEVPSSAAYDRLAVLGFEYGPAFQGVRRVAIADDEGFAVLQAPEAIRDDLDAYHLHPAMLDAALHSMILVAVLQQGERGAYLPVGFDRIVVHSRIGEKVRAVLKLRRYDDEILSGDLELIDEEGRLVAEIEGARAQALESKRSGDLRPDQLIFGVEWRAAETPKPEASGAAWVIFADDADCAQALKRRRMQSGERTILVRRGEEFLADDDEYRLDPRRPEHFETLCEALCGIDEALEIVHLWSLDAPFGEDVDARELMTAQDDGTVSVLHLIRALEVADWREIPRLTLVTHGGVSVADEAASPAQAPLWGFGRAVFHQEHPELRGRLIDLDPDFAADAQAQRLSAVLSDQDREDQWALRGEQLFVPRLASGPARSAGEELFAEAGPRFRDDGTYVVTGGLGGLGLKFAKWLVDGGVKHLSLLGRTPLPPRETWDSIDPESRAASRIAAVRDLERRGVEVRTASVDLSDPSSLAAWHAQHRETGGPPIRGVVHSAGVAVARLLSHMNADDLLDDLSAKLVGGWALHQELQDEPIEIFILMSSFSALGMTLGLSGYSAANAALDGLAHYRRAIGLPAISVNWGPWGDVGMASSDEMTRDLNGRGFLPIAPDQGLRAMERLLELDRAQFAAGEIDWHRASQRSYPTSPPAMVDEMIEQAAMQQDLENPQTEEAASEDLTEKLARSDAEERGEILVAYLQGAVASSLRLAAKDLDVAQPIVAHGLDSLIAIELKSKIEGALGFGPSVVELLQGVSVEGLAGQILPRLSNLEASSLEASNSDAPEALREAS